MKYDCKLKLPLWCQTFMDKQQERICISDSEKMSLAIELSHQNTIIGTGGPFGAAVFDKNGKIIGIGVNVVISSCCSMAHAEIMALMLAQQNVRRHRLKTESNDGFVLATSAQPCSMCFGALPWAGIDRLLCGAQREDVETITGFSEGPLPDNWVQLLEKYGIKTATGIMRDHAVTVLKKYHELNGHLY